MEKKTATEIIAYPEVLHDAGSIGFVEKLVIGQLLLITQPKLVIETGTLDGHTTRYLAGFLEENGIGDCRIATFDLVDCHNKIRESSDLLETFPNVELVSGYLPGTLREYLRKSDRPVDFAILDAMHSYEAVAAELKLVHRYLSDGGYLFCHDYRENDPAYHGVVYAIDHFAGNYGYDLLPLNPSTWKGGEVVWGAALLRKPLAGRSRLKGLAYMTRVAKVFDLGRRAIRKARKIREAKKS